MYRILTLQLVLNSSPLLDSRAVLVKDEFLRPILLATLAMKADFFTTCLYIALIKLDAGH